MSSRGGGDGRGEGSESKLNDGFEKIGGELVGDRRRAVLFAGEGTGVMNTAEGHRWQRCSSPSSLSSLPSRVLCFVLLHLITSLGIRWIVNGFCFLDPLRSTSNWV